MDYSHPGRQLSASTVCPRQGSAGHGKQLKPSGGGLSTGLRQTLHSFSTLLCIPDIQGEEQRQPGAPRSPPGAELPAVQGQLWLKPRARLPPSREGSERREAGLVAQGAVRTTSSLCSGGGDGVRH